jgi:hypothetical protein
LKNFKFTILRGLFAAALLVPAIPVMADHEEDREHPGLHQGWDKKHHGWAKGHEKKRKSNDDHYTRHGVDYGKLDWHDDYDYGQDVNYDRRNARNMEIRKDVSDVRAARKELGEDRLQLKKNVEELKRDRVELRKDIRNEASRTEIAQDRREIREDLQKIAESKRELRQSKTQLETARQELRDDWRKR